MLTRVCDRCGKKIGDRRLIRRRIMVLGISALPIEEFDLCADCNIEFSRFIKAKKQKNEKTEES